eukprot:7311786-Pyramimonas_sp.AAC.1
MAPPRPIWHTPSHVSWPHGELQRKLCPQRGAHSCVWFRMAEYLRRAPGQPVSRSAGQPVSRSNSQLVN